MELVWREVGDRVSSTEEVVDVPAGKVMTIETSPVGQEILSEVTPAGKSRNYFIRVTVIETNA